MQMQPEQEQAALIRLVEKGFAQFGQLSPRRFKLIATRIEPTGSPPKHFKVFASLFFLKGGEPFCCGEPGCYSEMLRTSDSRLGEFLRSGLTLQHELTVELETSPVYFEGILFTAFGPRAGYVDCPCCGYRTLDGRPASGQICEVCSWEDLERGDPDAPSAPKGHNLGLSLHQGRANFLTMGACHENHLASVRPPIDEERAELAHGKPPEGA